MILRKKTAVITGCNRGIGKAALETFAKHGANIFAVVRKVTDDFLAFCKKTESENSVKIFTIAMDITKEDEVKAGISAISAQKIPIDILVNNAGIVGESNLFLMTNIAKQKEIFETNFFGNMLVTQYIARLMLRNKNGSIVNIASVAGIDGEPAQLEYVASKAAIIGATKKLAREFAPSGIRVNAAAPGLTETDMAEKVTKDLKEKIVDKIMLKRLARPEEIANAILFLASELSSYMTGQIIRVDGGI